MALFKNPKLQFLFFLALFFVINLLQSIYTGLLEDEAYYWVWSENLAWGYFDHPPLVALFIWLGGLLFEGELGVRIMSALAFGLMLWLMWKTIDLRDKDRYTGLFFLLIVSLALLQVYGFISTPDTPLLLSTAFFFWVYKRFLEHEGTKDSLLLGISMAAMLYSKYHGVLIIGFVVLSNLRLLMSSRFWLAALTGLLLYLPHMFWQFDHGFPSFVYHLMDRSHKPYEIGFTLNHLLNVIAVVGITFPVIYTALFKTKAENPFDRSLKFVVYGFVLFFFLASFRSQPQAQWLAAMLIPLCLLIFPYFASNPEPRKWLYRLGLAQLVIIVIARLLLAIPSISPLVLEPHLAETWVPQLKAKTGERPIVFVNSYQNASLYKFYTGIETHSFGLPKGRKSQYFLLDTESRMQGRTVFGVGKQLTDRTFLVDKGAEELYGYEIDSFRSFQRLTCLIDFDELDLVEDQQVRVPFSLKNPYAEPVDLNTMRFFAVFQGVKKVILSEIPLDLKPAGPVGPGDEIELEARFRVPAIDARDSDLVTLRIGISFEGLPPGIQGNKVLVNYHPVKNKDQ